MEHTIQLSANANAAITKLLSLFVSFVCLSLQPTHTHRKKSTNKNEVNRATKHGQSM